MMSKLSIIILKDTLYPMCYQLVERILLQKLPAAKKGGSDSTLIIIIIIDFKVK